MPQPPSQRRTRPPVERRRRLSRAALAVTNQKVRRAYSPIVIAGAVRVADFAAVEPGRRCASISATWCAIDGFHWPYVAAIFRHGRYRGDLLPGCRHLRGAGVSRPAPADDADDLVLGIRVPAVHRRLVLRQARRRGIAALAVGIFLRRPRDADRRTAVAARDGAQLGAPRPARSPHHHRRLRSERRKAGRSAHDPGRFRHRYPRRVRRPQRQPCARHLRRRPETRQGRRHHRVRPPHPRRSRAVRAADFGGDPDSRNAEEAVGAAGRHPAVRPYQQAALPPPRLFLSRQGSDPRRVRDADHRLGSGDEMAVRPYRRRHRPAAGRAADGAGRARGQARQSGAGAVPPEAVRLQQ